MMTERNVDSLSPEDAFTKALGMLGGATEAARQLGVSRSYLYRVKQCPDGLVMKLSRLTGRRITVHDLRPDIYFSSREEFLENT